jgi:protein-tyrosine phosphatase
MEQLKTNLSVKTEIEHLRNYRDLGGLPLRSGGATRPFVFLRSEVPVAMRESDRLYLLLHGVTTIVDLRRERELQRRPNVLSIDDRFDYRHVSLIQSDFVIHQNMNYSADEYMRILREERTGILQALRACAEVAGGVLFHCAVGKDRTGVLAALLLMIAGAEDEVIVRDYGRSYDNLIGLCGAGAETAFKIIPYPVVMRRMLLLFHEAYGSIDGYLDEIGFSAEEREKIRRKFVTPLDGK